MVLLLIGERSVIFQTLQHLLFQISSFYFTGNETITKTTKKQCVDFKKLLHIKTFNRKLMAKVYLDIKEKSTFYYV